MPFTYDDIPERCVACSADLEEAQQCVIHKASAEADEQALCPDCWEKAVPNGCYDDLNEGHGLCEECGDWAPFEGCGRVIAGMCDGGCGKDNICTACCDYHEERGEMLCNQCYEEAEEEDSEEEEEPAAPAAAPPPPPQLPYRQTVEHRVGSLTVSVEVSAATEAELAEAVAKLRASISSSFKV